MDRASASQSSAARQSLIVGIAAFSVVLALAVPAFGHGAGWVEANCIARGSSTNHYNMSSWKRANAKSYAYTGRYEGYTWAGGCWDNDDVHESKNEPQETVNHGEGPDCSGFTFKAWAMKITYGATGFSHWLTLGDEHGPYTAANFKAGAGPTSVIGSQPSYSQTTYMDAFASSTHIGMIYAEGTSNNQDQIIEAKGEADGTVIATRTYRGSSSYTAVKRDSWTPQRRLRSSMVVGSRAVASAFASLGLVACATAGPSSATTQSHPNPPISLPAQPAPTDSTMQDSSVDHTQRVEIDFMATPVTSVESVVAPFGPGPNTLEFVDGPTVDGLPLVPTGFSPIPGGFVVADPARARLAMIDLDGQVTDSLPLSASVEDVLALADGRILVVLESGAELGVVTEAGVVERFEVQADREADLIIGELVANGENAGGWFFSVDDPPTYDGLYQLPRESLGTQHLRTKTGVCGELCVDARFHNENTLSLLIDDSAWTISFQTLRDSGTPPLVSIDSTVITTNRAYLLLRISDRCPGCEGYFLLAGDQHDIGLARIDAAAHTEWDPMIRSRLRADANGGLWLLDLNEDELAISQLCFGESVPEACGG